MDGDLFDEPAAALGVVPVEGRGSLPYALVHGESLVAAASWALSSAGVELVDLATTYDEVRGSGQVLVLHDPLCPLTPAEFLAEAVRVCTESGSVVVGARPVTDTVKPLREGRVGPSVDRAELLCVTSPVVVPVAVLQALDAVVADDLAVLVDQLSGRFPVRFLEAPAQGRRVTGAADLALLEALTRRSG